MDARTADASRFFFRLAGHPDDAFTVLGFKSKDHGLSRDYTFKIRLETERAWTPEEVVGRDGVLELRTGAEPAWVHGVVAGGT